MRRKGWRPWFEGYEQYSAWRKGIDPVIYKSLNRYARYCAGQVIAMSEVLDNQAVRFACEADRIQPALWHEIVEDMHAIHAGVMRKVERPRG